MTTVAIFNISVIFYAYLARQKPTEFWLKGSFVLIFLFLALRYDYGNDYGAYLKTFQEINRISSIDFFDKYWRFEPGWIFLCRLFKPLGFFAMTAALALFTCIVYYRFIKKYVPQNYYWLAVFCYVFNPRFMLVHSSAMRQSLAIAIFVYSIDYIYKKDILCYCLCVVLASLFHSSALILLPVYFIGLFNYKIGKIMATSLFSSFLLAFVFVKSFLPNINQFINVFFEKYEVYEGGAEIGTGLGLFLYGYLLLLILFYDRFQTEESSVLFKIAIISFFVIPLGLSISMIGRIGMYFQPATIAVFPIIFCGMKNKIQKTLSQSVLILIYLYSFYDFFHTDVWKVAFGTYKTIFSAPEIF